MSAVDHARRVRDHDARQHGAAKIAWCRYGDAGRIRSMHDRAGDFGEGAAESVDRGDDDGVAGSGVVEQRHQSRTSGIRRSGKLVGEHPVGADPECDERRAFFDIPDGAPFYEETTYWNPSWTMTHGAIQTSNIYDLEATAAGVGSGRLLTEDSYRRMISTDLRGKTRAQPGCPICFAQTDYYTYGLGIIISAEWVLQNPLFAGYAALAAYLRPEEVAIAVAVTFEPAAFDADGDYHNEADTLFRKIATELEPDHAPPRRPAK